MWCITGLSTLHGFRGLGHSYGYGKLLHVAPISKNSLDSKGGDIIAETWVERCSGSRVRTEPGQNLYLLHIRTA